MKFSIIHRIRKINPWYLILASVAASEILTAIVVSIMSFLLRGEVVFNYMLTGAVTAFIVSIIVVSVIIVLIQSVGFSEDRFQAFMKHSQAVAFIKDPEGRYMFVNATWERFYEKKLSDVLNKTNKDLFPSETADRLTRDDREVLESGKPKQLVESVPGPKGVRKFLTHKFPILGPDGRPSMVAGMAMDVTDLENAKKAVEVSENKYRTFFDTALDGVLIVDPETRRILDANGIIAERLGYTHEELLEIRIDDINPPDFDPAADAPLKGLSEGKPVVFERDHRRKDGVIVPTEISARMVDFGDRKLLVGFHKDITERREYERALQESEEKFRMLAENASDIVYRYFIKPELRIEYLSPSVQKILGYPTQEFYDDPYILQRITHKDDRQWMMGRLGGKSLETTMELRCYHRSGSLVWLELSSTVLRDESGNPVGFEGMARDVTERKKADTALRESEEKYRTLIETANDAIFVADAESGALIDANWKAERLVGRSREDIIGRHQSELHPEDEIEKYRKHFEKAVKTGKPPEETLYVVDVEGALTPVEVSVSLTTIKGQKAVIGIFRDITDRFRSEAALRESEKRFREFAEHSSDVIFRYRLKPDRGFEYVSPSVTGVTGYTPEEHYADPDLGLAITHPADRAKVHELQEGTHNERTMEVRWIHKDGRIIWTEQKTNYRLDDTGEPYLVEGIARDITRRKIAEEALRKKTALTKLLQEITAETNEALTADDAMRTCLEKVCEFTGWEIGHIFVPDDRGVLIPSGIWRSNGSDQFEKFKRLTECVSFKPGEGLPGRVCSAGAPSWILDVKRDKNFIRTGVMEEIGLKSAFAFPVLEGKKVAAVLEFFSWGMDEPDEAMLEAVNSLATLLGRVTERKKVGEKLQLAQKIIDSASEAVMVTDTEGVIQSVNNAFVDVTGYTEEEALGNKPNLLRSGRHDKHFYELMWKALNNDGHWEGEIWNRRKNGEAFPEWLSITSITDAAGKTVQYAAIFNDISEHKKSQEEIEYRAYHDALTGLPNRSLLMDRLEHAVARAHRNESSMAVLFLDLDNFKHINDSLGHTTGDLLLKGAAVRLVTCLREGDTVCRFGGDEFTVLLENIENEYEVITIANRILETLTEPYLFEDEELVSTVSIGISLYPSDGLTADDLIRSADMAMYHAKEEGKNNYRFYLKAMDDRFAKRFEMENNLRRALENKEMVAWYQPKVSLDTGRITGMEALVRWIRPDGSMAPPGEFIPLAEEIGLVSQIDEWILRSACRFISRLRENGHDGVSASVNVSVNLSARNLERAEIADVIAQIVTEAGVDPGAIELEVTESAIIKNMEQAVEIIRKLRDSGFNVSIDDFGSGYSSMNYIRRFFINIIKLDRSLIMDLETSKDSRIMTKGIISIAHELDMKVVAEGVEDRFQVDFLKEVGCDEVQGFYFSRPAPEAEMEKMLREGKVL